MYFVKRKVFLSITILFAIFIIGCSSSDTASNNGGSKESNKNEDETITLKVSVMQSDEHPITVNGYKPFMDKVEELTDGKIQFEFYPAEQLGSSLDFLDMTATGSVDIAYFNLMFNASETQIGSSLVAMPGLYDSDYKGAVAFHKSIKRDPMLQKDYLDNGVRPLWGITVPVYKFWAVDSPIRVPSDLNGKKVSGAGGVQNAAYSELGMTPVTLTGPELYGAYDTGILKYLSVHAGGVKDYGLTEIINYGLDVNMGGTGLGLIINEQKFQSLSEDLQDALLTASDEIAEELASFYDNYEKEVIKEFEESGIIEMHELTDSERAEWDSFFNEFSEKWINSLDVEGIEDAREVFQEELDKLSN